ncbi:Uncharacterized membrane protein YhaH, DUF805 family [Enhydrobacter aerosaccus]|uniref:Uncharacterized membrane protein YhaH, DUF805 family n=1 Tax=Enhydrobacter aerosaccus TaxID=225324 RepID=A0A1T4JK87_9HYPH|nr:DUF805 domain-containing protein [Enhydrobacter aerosaccus]SJZ30487.1 Uncharacterized membrane protein YhaH, DUF805 family [Enhydrobacter aerosaccus]
MQSLLFSFDGRVNRATFWLTLISVDIVVVILLGVLGIVGGASVMPDADGNLPPPSLGVSIGALILFILSTWIGLAMGVKRFHDRNKSGWWVLINLVPVIGGLWYLIECGFLKGTAGPNQYGPDPLAIS